MQFLPCLLLVLCFENVIGQNFGFYEIKPPSGIFFGQVGGMAQDKEGYIWIAAREGLFKYDGKNFKKFVPKGDVDFRLETIYIDHEGIIWLPTWTSAIGMYSYDPYKNEFTPFRHNKDDNTSISNGYVRAVTEDNDHNLWIGTYNGLNLYDRKTKTFKKYIHNPDDSLSISSNIIRSLMVDKMGDLWIGCGSNWPGEGSISDGGLNKLDIKSGKFKRYEARNGFSGLKNNKVQSLFEDSNGTIWIGTGGDGLHSFDRANGVVIHHGFDKNNPNKLSRPEVNPFFSPAFITFINEDARKRLWIGTIDNGLLIWDPKTKQKTHILDQPHLWSFLKTNDGNVFFAQHLGKILKLDILKPEVKFFKHPTAVNSILVDPGENIWLGTNEGVSIRDKQHKIIHTFKHDQKANSISNDGVTFIFQDSIGTTWIGTINGLNRYHETDHSFSRYLPPMHTATKVFEPISIRGLADHSVDSLWVGTQSHGLLLMNKKNGGFIKFIHDQEDSTSIAGNSIATMFKDKSGNLWIGHWLFDGLSYLDASSTKFKKYFTNPGSTIMDIQQDKKGMFWIQSDLNLFNLKHPDSGMIKLDFPREFYNNDPFGSLLIDINDNAWKIGSTTTTVISKLNSKYSFRFLEIQDNTWTFSNGVAQDKNGVIYLRSTEGYYKISPDYLVANQIPPILVLNKLEVSDLRNKRNKTFGLKELEDRDPMEFSNSENNIEFSVNALHYSNPEKNIFEYQLLPFDIEWRSVPDVNSIRFSNLSPGNFTFNLRAVTPDGFSANTSLKFRIKHPWWQSTLAVIGWIILSGLLLWLFIKYRERALREEKSTLENAVLNRTLELNRSLESLKTTQAQLIQSEKMASLGELTAGIAHEIQNPLNFVNNFSEVNGELIREMKQDLIIGNEQLEKGDIQNSLRNFKNAMEVTIDIEANSEKINLHGQRASSIVKSMLEHSRTSTGEKTLTDINKLCEEYMKLSYQGMRVKYKEKAGEKTGFNADYKLDLDPSIPKINMVSQDMARAILNLLNNAFQACLDRSMSKVYDGSNTVTSDFKPLVVLSTKRKDEKIFISISDNGNGIPENIKDKIFQPFFTTKPSGQGTGLGLSLAYDIVKAHGGVINLESTNKDRTCFEIRLPINPGM